MFRRLRIKSWARVSLSARSRPGNYAEDRSQLAQSWYFKVILMEGHVAKANPVAVKASSARGEIVSAQTATH
jgi:hypothetical protein